MGGPSTISRLLVCRRERLRSGFSKIKDQITILENDYFYYFVKLFSKILKGYSMLDAKS